RLPSQHLLGRLVLADVTDIGKDQQSRPHYGQVDAQIEQHGGRQLDLADQRYMEVAEGRRQERIAAGPATQPREPRYQHAGTGDAVVANGWRSCAQVTP